MIQIDDFDSTITAAQKIIHGTRQARQPQNEAVKTLAELGGDGTVDMFSPDEIKEIIEYLSVYYDHRENYGDI
jgi:hypothetical protein